MSQVANNMDNALEAMEKAQPVEKVQPTTNAPVPTTGTQQKVIVRSFSRRFMLFLSVVAVVIIVEVGAVLVRMYFGF